MLHLIKLAVGVADLAALAERQAERKDGDGRPFLRTRNTPRRAAEILDGGSIYWVISGVLLCRQRVAAIAADRREDGTPCTAIALEGATIAVLPRRIRAFQGWRYLQAADAPEDLGARSATGGDVLPVAMRRDLAALCLL